MDFKEFSFHPAIAGAIKKCGYITPTSIQWRAIPLLLEGRDLFGLAQTGTGKTAAFVLPTLQNLATTPQKGVRALILTPTRELAEQVHGNIQQLSQGLQLKSCTIYGGVSKYTQVKKLKKGIDIIVACPGRLLDHLHSKSIDLSTIEVLILDEADQMCDKGFLPDIRRILKQIPSQRQSMVFSATMPGEVHDIVEDILTEPATVQIDHNKPATTISHGLYQVLHSRKTELLKNILQDSDISATLIFTRTKHKAKKLAGQLQQSGFKATSLQGNLSQHQRKMAMDGFRNGKYSILVATDIAARGIDVSGITHVVNYDAPDTVEAYTHRVGRTGRAQKSGQALTFATRDDEKIIRLVEKSLGKKLSRKVVDGFEIQPDRTPAPRGKGNVPVGTKRKKNVGHSGRGNQRRSTKHQSASFDFGLSTR
jgi:superfamily II DNA/RNA helicase